MANVWDYLKENTYSKIIQDTLKRVQDDVDKRQGSVVFDMLAPSVAVAAQLYVDLMLYYQNTYLLTATGKGLDDIGGNYDIQRLQSTYSVRKGIFKFDDGRPYPIEIGTRFSTETTENNPIFYKVIKKITDGEYELQCEIIGTIGNDYVGFLLPVTNIPQLGSAYIDTVLIPARNTENDNAFRERILEWLNNKPFGGNIAHYRQWALEFAGIGAVQVYPVWNGGGTVKLSVVDPQYSPVSQEFIEIVKEYFDPTEHTGEGLGVAPIDHRVTIVTPSEIKINVAAKIVTRDSTPASWLTEKATEVIKEYIDSVRESWGYGGTTNTYIVAVYISKIIARLDDLENVLNVESVTINGQSRDLILQNNSILQQIPSLGSVTINE